jgi:hypothetical protein
MRPSLLALTIVLAGCSTTDHSGGDMIAAVDLAVSDCPDYRPSSGAGGGGSCSRPDATCLYFEAYCHCNTRSSTWYCCSDGARQLCPPLPPSGDDCCRAYLTACTYGCVGGIATSCTCSDDRWQCTSSACD